MNNKEPLADVDKYDLAILSALATDTRLTTVEIAAIVHLSRTAVSRRIAALKRMGVLISSAEVLNYESIGFGVRAVVEVVVPGRMAQALKEELLLRPEVLTISIIACDDLMSLDVVAIDMGHLHSFVGSLQHSGDTSTKVVIAEEKSQLTLVERMRILAEERAHRIV
jgi:DNA-binding Lrp family transcriptional regulator